MSLFDAVEASRQEVGSAIERLLESVSSELQKSQRVIMAAMAESSQAVQQHLSECSGELSKAKASSKQDVTASLVDNLTCYRATTKM